MRDPANPRDLDLLNRYAAAFENADITALTELLRDDAVLEMPPMLTWFTGRDHIRRFLQSHVLRRPGDFILIPAAANGQPAWAEYQRGPDGVHHVHGVQVLTVAGSRVARIAAFHHPGLFAAFGLPPTLPAATALIR
jgi:RNA polymerase sigma-70 factor (ECF subfamily)